VGRLLRFGPRGKKRKNTGGLGCKGEMGEGDLFCVFFSIPFISFSSFYSKTFSKNFRQTFDHTINSKSMHST
jgi:hypothetical protein